MNSLQNGCVDGREEGDQNFGSTQLPLQQAGSVLSSPTLEAEILGHKGNHVWYVENINAELGLVRKIVTKPICGGVGITLTTCYEGVASELWEWLEMS